MHTRKLCPLYPNHNLVRSAKAIDMLLVPLQPPSLSTLRKLLRSSQIADTNRSAAFACSYSHIYHLTHILLSKPTCQNNKQLLSISPPHHNTPHPAFLHLVSPFTHPIVYLAQEPHALQQSRNTTTPNCPQFPLAKFLYNSSIPLSTTRVHPPILTISLLGSPTITVPPRSDNCLALAFSPCRR